MINFLTEILSYPFMQRAFIAGIILSAAIAYLGIFVVLRRMSFFSDGIAHASLAGIAAAIIFGWNPLPVALLASVVFAVLIYLLERKTKISTDAAIGIIFTAGMALGVVLMSLKAGYQPEMVSFLFGNILSISNGDLWLVAGFSALILAFLIFNRSRIILFSLDHELAHTAGMKPAIYQLLMYVLTAGAVVLGIKMLGIILVSAALIIPVSAAKVFSASFRSLEWWTVAVAEAMMISGIILSYYLNLPTGAVIVLCGAFFFLIASLWQIKGSRY